MNMSQIGEAQTSRLGYGCMRFPVDGEGHIDFQETERLFARAIEGGVTYFDTAWPYHNGESEVVVGEILSRYPRDRFQLATTLPCWEIKSAQMAVERLDSQLERLDTDYVDFYLLHALNRFTWKKMVDLGVVEALEEQQKLGKIRQFGFSFHDGYEIFESILNHRKWDFCQIQLNYMDTELQAGMRGYTLAEKMGVPLVIMEPLKGGMLAQLPAEVMEPLLHIAPEASVASWGMRWLLSLPNVKVVLSGMSAMEQLEDNLATFSEAKSLSEVEQAGVVEVTKRLRQRLKNGCTGCRYCIPCPVGVDIPGNFRAWNLKSVFGVRNEVERVWAFLDPEEKASNCIGCGKCEKLCPQMIPIRQHLSGITEEIETFLHNKD